MHALEVKEPIFRVATQDLYSESIWQISSIV